MIRATSAALLLAALVACGPGPAPGASAESVCGALFDSTTFRENYGLDAKLETEFPAALKQQGCARVHIASIRGVADGACSIDSAQVEPTTPGGPAQLDGDRKVLVARARTRIDGQLACAEQPGTPPGSDVVGALRVLAAHVRADRRDREGVQLLVWSDMGQRDDKINIYAKDALATPAARKEIIEILAARGLPRLDGVTVRIFGFGTGVAKDATRESDLRSFWDELFAASGDPAVAGVEGVGRETV
ncbi:hypothetical protein Acor_37560 [Acrocarpospora corrugata]|uniref:Lipoprotein n=1 Tax=Acrocarpospora corrugata TaxID=35763 RepID=A0A5M3W0Y7_9ACTN|nr:hypothetical protein [Acrocarpospora corrugata]GES01692.1 hypothetical protein Acor_37560 [Acrocarpospora corrugata]